ncbi:MAG: TrbI/VirB10 family protein [Pseudomonadota bacterium]
MNTEDQLSPDASPEQVKKAGVRRVNNLPVYILGGVVGMFLLVMMLVAADRAEKQNRPAEAKAEKAGNTSMFASKIAGDQKDGIIQPAKTVAAPVTVPELSAPATGALAVARPDKLDLPPPPPPLRRPSSQADQQMNDVMDRMRIAKLQQLEEAVKAKTGIQVSAPRSAGSAPGGTLNNGAPATREESLARLAANRQQIDARTRDNPAAAYQARLQQMQADGSNAAGAGAGGSTAPRLVAAQSGGGKDYQQFSRSGQDDRWKLDSQLEAPRSPYELRAGFVLPATLLSGINSELPGQIIAQVSLDVFDTATGKWKLIPQGSRLVGRYSSEVVYGQSRVLIAWQRIIFPDGKAMDIGSMPGADSAGYAGFNDQVNNHYFRLFGSALLMSGVTAGIALSQDRSSSSSIFRNEQSASGALSEALGQQLGQVTAQMIAKNLNISPTLEIRPGYRFNVMVVKDLTFSKPYQAFDY